MANSVVHIKFVLKKPQMKWAQNWSWILTCAFRLGKKILQVYCIVFMYLFIIDHPNFLFLFLILSALIFMPQTFSNKVTYTHSLTFQKCYLNLMITCSPRKGNERSWKLSAALRLCRLNVGVVKRQFVEWRAELREVSGKHHTPIPNCINDYSLLQQAETGIKEGETSTEGRDPSTQSHVYECTCVHELKIEALKNKSALWVLIL